ncbi:MAG TPA: ABC transporter permease [Gaiellaceae bacterium]|nr:ABC transporter permease [Gaiellaceae bacterium]
MGFSGHAAASNAALAARFAPVWLATAALTIVAAIVAPATLQSTSWSFVLPEATVLAIAAVGQMLVVMHGGIDLSTPAVISLGGNLIAGLGSSHGLAVAIVAAVAVGVGIGLTNGVLVGLLRLNPLIVTLAVGQIVLAWSSKYSRDVVTAQPLVPSSLASWVTRKPLGVSNVFWTGVVLTVAVALVLRYLPVGRRFQAVGANPKAAWIAGLHVRTHVVLAYTSAGALYAVGAVLLAGVHGSIDPAFGSEFLLAPIAAVVIGGASLAGGLASTTSTWLAALALTLLTQMLVIMGLSAAMQYVVFGAAIIAGMVVSGDRVAAAFGRALRSARTTPAAAPTGGHGGTGG